MKSVRELRRALGAHVDESRAIYEKAEQDGGPRTADEEKELRRLDSVMDQLEADIRRAEREERLALPVGSAPLRHDAPPLDDPTPKPPPTGARFRDVKTGKEIRALTPRESVAESLGMKPEERELSLGRWLQGWATGNWDHAPLEKRLLSVGTYGAGGALVPLPGPFAGQLIDLARSKSVVFNMGAPTIPMAAPTLRLARVTGDPTMTWFDGDEVRATGIPESQGSFGSFELQTQTGAILERASVELAESTANFAQVAENQLGAAAALGLDKMILYGTPSGVHDGLRQWLTNDATNSLNAVASATNGDQLTDYSKFITAARLCLDGNYPGDADQLGLVWAPRTWGIVVGLKQATTNAPLLGPSFFERMKKLTSTQISVTETQGSSNVASTAFLGDWTQVLVGIHTEPRVEISREAGDAFSRLHVMFRVYLRADFVVLQPKWLTRITGLIP